jgi:hypothetical protein
VCVDMSQHAISLRAGTKSREGGRGFKTTHTIPSS